MNILDINKLALELVAKDFSNGHSPTNGGPTKTSRALAIIHLAAHDAYAKVTGLLNPQLSSLPRLYNQVVLAIPEFQALAHDQKIKVLTAINVAMADAGIAAWHWKYAYDFWRPVLGIREADQGWGPTGQGDGNTIRAKQGDPFWLPLGAPKSNPFPNPTFGASGSNFTPNFPAYPSGHATFGSACFETVAALLGKTPEEITVKFVSDEFNGMTTDNNGTTRPRWEAVFTLREAIEQNKISRIYLGVHWLFDATGGEVVGKAVANKVIAAFP